MSGGEPTGDGPMVPSDPVVVVAHVPDLMDRSRLQAVAGVEWVFVSAPALLARAADEAGASTVVVDLARSGVLQAVAAGGFSVRVVGFASHVDDALIAAARQVGCTEVLPRSRFFARLAQVVGADRPGK